MCGRFALYSDPPAVTLRLGLPEPDQPWTPRYNVSPGTWITGVCRREPDAEPIIDNVWWGYLPAWAKEGAPHPINAKSETVATSRYFQAAFKRHRCLIPADGWYEWLPTEHGKQPHYLTRLDRSPLFLAGIWTERADGSPGCAIITEPARGVARDVHDRMPLALDDESLEPWLDSDLTERSAIRGIVRHIPAELLTHWPVSTRVNRVGNDDARLIESVDAT